MVAMHLGQGGNISLLGRASGQWTSFRIIHHGSSQSEWLRPDIVEDSADSLQEKETSEQVKSSKHAVASEDMNAANADFAAALGQDPPSPWGRGHLALYGCCLIVYLCSTMNGQSREALLGMSLPDT
jgi:hypothetical protein